jgi:hypothetical protein
MLDVVFVEPYPTREFAQRWCLEQENKLVSVSGTTIACAALTAALLASLTMAVLSFEKTPASDGPLDQGGFPVGSAGPEFRT